MPVDMVSAPVRECLQQERAFVSKLLEHLLRFGAPENELQQARLTQRGLDEGFLLVVVGEFNAGKSSLINALLGATVLEEGVTPTTDKISILVQGPQDTTRPYDGVEADNSDGFVLRRELPYQFLDGVALVDTPGTNAVIRRHQALTESFLPRADLVLFLTSADRPFTESEKQFLTLAKTWGRKVVVVVTKADLLERQNDIETVQSFVTENAREVLGLQPKVFLVSVRRFLREGNDAGFVALQAHLRETLSERDRTRLKLLSPLGVATELSERSAARAKASIEVLRSDTLNLSDLESHFAMHQKDLASDLEGQLKHMDAVLGGIEKRGDVFIDDTLRVSKALELLNQDKVRNAFASRVIADAPVELERRVNAVIDQFIERNVHFWDFVQRFLNERAQTALVGDRASLLQGARFQYDRQTLLGNIGENAAKEIQGIDRETISRNLAADAQTSIITSGMVGVGGLGLGALIAAVATSRIVDFTGILLGITVAGFGFFILPRKRAQAKLELRNRIDETRNRLREVLTREHQLEAERSGSRLRDAIAPYSRFVRAETEKLEAAAKEAALLAQEVRDVQTKVEAL